MRWRKKTHKFIGGLIESLKHARQEFLCVLLLGIEELLMSMTNKSPQRCNAHWGLTSRSLAYNFLQLISNLTMPGRAAIAENTCQCKICDRR